MRPVDFYLQVKNTPKIVAVFKIKAEIIGGRVKKGDLFYFDEGSLWHVKSNVPYTIYPYNYDYVGYKQIVKGKLYPMN